MKTKIIYSCFTVWVIISIFIIYDLNNSLNNSYKAFNNIDDIEKEAREKLQKAYKESDNIEKASIKRIEILSDKIKEQEERLKFVTHLESKRMHELYPDYKKLKFGRNIVDDKYVKGFVLQQESVEFELENKSSSVITPNFIILFIDQIGMVTEHITIKWEEQEIKQKETRKDGKDISFRFGDPVYYKIYFQGEL